MHYIGGFVDPGAGLALVMKRKISCSYWELKSMVQSQLVKFPAFCSTQRFITMFRRAHYQTLS